MRDSIRTHEILGCALPTAALLAALACANAPVLPPDAHTPSKETYVIGATDQLHISVWKNSELGATVPVRTDGMISVPLLDDVQAEGLTPEELKEVITASLAEYVKAPDVTVVVVQMNSHMASVLGNGIARKGLVPLRRDTTILEAIATMGGFTTFANKDNIRVLRKSGSGTVEYRFNYNAFVSGKAPGSNFLLKPGDTILVSD